MPTLLFVVNETYFFMTHRLAVAKAAAARGYEIHVAGPNDHVWAPNDFSVDELTKAGFIYHEIPLSRRGMNPVHELHTIWALWRLYRNLRPALIHHLTIKPIMYGGIAARIVRAPSVVNTVTGLGQVFVGRGILASILRAGVKALYRFALAHPNSVIIAQNREDGDTFVNLRLAERNHIHLIRGSGVSLDQFVPTPEPSDVPLVVLPARLIWEKGISEFVKAAEQLRQSGVSARFALVGDTQPSNPRSVPEPQLRAWQEAGSIEWWGRKTDMPEVLAQSHVVCLPSSYGEGVPKALLEAAASARPIVCTDIPGCQEVVRHGVNGLTVPVSDTGALAEALRQLLESENLRRSFGAAGRKIAEAEFGEDRIAQQTLAVYESVLGNGFAAKSR